MKKHLPLALLAALVVLPGCTSIGGIRSWLGIKPSATDYGPFAAEPKAVWEATRDVLADMDFTFAKVDRTEWFLESRWLAYGTDWSHENHRNRVTVELEEVGGGTEMHLLVETEVNSNTDPMVPTQADWAQEDPDLDMQNEIVYRVRKKLSGGNGDIFEKTYERLNEEDSRKPKKKMEYDERQK